MESTLHFLFVCPRWKEERWAMREAHKERFGDLSFAVGGCTTYTRNGKTADGDLDKWKPNIEAVHATIKFARDPKDSLPIFWSLLSLNHLNT